MYLYKKVIKILLNKKISISFAESCTGGLLSKTLTDVPGISSVFNMGLITYSNDSKNSILRIPKSWLNKYGAVSEEVAHLMSKNLYKISKSNICISTTGITGPSGGSKEKPVGLVFIGITFNKKTHVIKKNFNGSRKKIQISIIDACFNEIIKLINLKYHQPS